MHLHNQLMWSVVRIQATSATGTSVGTGFWYKLISNDQGAAVGLITNKHVIEGAEKIEFSVSFTRNGSSEMHHEMVAFDLRNTHIISHPDEKVDLCAIVASELFNWLQEKGGEARIRVLQEQELADKSFFDRTLPAEEILMVGYPNGLWDRKNNGAIIRSGVVATNPGDDYEGRPEFMVDIACFPGSSGSPIYVAKTGARQDKSGTLVFGGAEFRLLGILWGGPQYAAEGNIIARPIPTSTQAVPITGIPNNLGFAIKATELKYLGDLAAERFQFQ
ncbi:S1 family peptidase [Vreelandella titanicae]|uniref:S1 family peptidase n=1 Tax=Vreelandella titanicae TaxID=664683 RepID=UPI00034C86F0|nr:serine protease [Halomonas titanicae]